MYGCRNDIRDRLIAALPQCLDPEGTLFPVVDLLDRNIPQDRQNALCRKVIRILLDAFTAGLRGSGDLLKLREHLTVLPDQYFCILFAERPCHEITSRAEKQPCYDMVLL